MLPKQSLLLCNRSLFSLGLLFTLFVSCSKTDSNSSSSGSGTTTTTSYNTLFIPPAVTGTSFNLTLAKATKQFLTGSATNTYAFNTASTNVSYWGPTLIMNQNDNITLNVQNNLTDTTTVHWHGLHIPAIMDGGPHQKIPPGSLWSPQFAIKNNAGTYWYHPHLHMTTQEQLAYGAGGLIIIKDATESALTLPRTYGTDDIPLVLASRKFSNNQIVPATIYGDTPVVNGTLNPQVTLPAQYVRFRILNADVERGYNVGFSDNRNFYVIATDGGLMNSPVLVNRVKLYVGERVEIVVDLSTIAVGSSVDIKAYNSNQTFGFPGSEPATSGTFGSLLNNRDFNLVHVVVSAATSGGVTTAPPAVLTNNVYWTNNQVTNRRTITITDGSPPTGIFKFDGLSYSPNVANQTVQLNAIEEWTITNNAVFDHAFHIHDVQFKITSRTSAGGITTYENGWKDVLQIHVNETVKFIAQFADFASPTDYYMYHCHFALHEDEGMMGQFLVQ